MLLEGGPTQLPDLPAGNFVRPVILRGEPANICARTEIFGPIAFAIPFRDEAEATRTRTPLRTDWPMPCGRPTRRVPTAWRPSSALGSIWLDCQLEFAPGIRYGGWHMSGMGGGVLAPDALLDYQRRKSVVRRAPDGEASA